MSKAEDRALEKYPLMSEDDKEGLEALKYIGMEFDCTSEYNEVQEAKQAYFIEGYRQAEKDLELTWEDIESIHILMAHQEVTPILWKCGNEAFYQEVLKRFKAQKGEEV